MHAAEPIGASQGRNDRVAELELELSRRTAERDALRGELEVLVHALAHDVRAPIRAMDGFTRVLAEECGTSLGPEAGEYLRFIRTGSRQLSAMVESLIELARVGRSAPKSVPVDMQAIITDVESVVRSRWPNRSDRLLLAPLPPALGDPELLTTLWTKLLENAFLATRETPAPEISVDAQPSPTRNGFAVYRIRDNGIGFASSAAHALFVPFRSLHERQRFSGRAAADTEIPARSSGLGLGVGLAIAQRIARAFGGDLEAIGHEGKGAEFLVTLPLAPST